MHLRNVISNVPARATISLPAQRNLMVLCWWADNSALLYFHWVYVFQDPDDARRYDDLPFKDSIYYPRFYPDWQYDPYRLSVAVGSALDAEKVRSLQPVAFPVTYNNPGFYGTRKGNSD